MTEDEMTYTEGGVTYSAAQCRNFVQAFGFASAQSLMAIATAAKTIAIVIKWVRCIGGPLSIIIGFAAAALAQAIGKVAYGIGYAAAKGKSVIFTVGTPFDSFVNVTWK
jgi:hypothetical protein